MEAFFIRIWEPLLAPLVVGCLVTCFGWWLNNRNGKR